MCHKLLHVREHVALVNSQVQHARVKSQLGDMCNGEFTVMWQTHSYVTNSQLCEKLTNIWQITVMWQITCDMPRSHVTWHITMRNERHITSEWVRSNTNESRSTAAHVTVTCAVPHYHVQREKSLTTVRHDLSIRAHVQQFVTQLYWIWLVYTW